MCKSKFKIIIISPPANISNEIENLTILFENGLNIFHLRKPTFSISQMQTYLYNIPAKYHSKIVVHSNYELVKNYNLKGIHLTEKQRNNHTRLENDSVVSTSFHTLSTWKTKHINYEYSFISPIFNSISKKDYKAKFNYNELKTHLTNYKACNTIALGGISNSNIKKTANLGFDGIAMIGNIWQKKISLKCICTSKKYHSKFINRKHAKHKRHYKFRKYF